MYVRHRAHACVRACGYACVRACVRACGVKCTFAAVSLKLEANGATIAVLHRVSAQKAASVCSDRRPPCVPRSALETAVLRRLFPVHVTSAVSFKPVQPSSRASSRRPSAYRPSQNDGCVPGQPSTLEGHGSFPFLMPSDGRPDGRGMGSSYPRRFESGKWLFAFSLRMRAVWRHDVFMTRAIPYAKRTALTRSGWLLYRHDTRTSTLPPPGELHSPGRCIHSMRWTTNTKRSRPTLKPRNRERKSQLEKQHDEIQTCTEA